MTINISSLRFDADQKLLQRIENKLRKMTRYYDRITSIDVKLKLEGSQKVKDKVIELIVYLPGNTIHIRHKSKRFENGTDAAIRNLKRRLTEHKARLVEK